MTLIVGESKISQAIEDGYWGVGEYRKELLAAQVTNMLSHLWGQIESQDKQSAQRAIAQSQQTCDRYINQKSTEIGIDSLLGRIKPFFDRQFQRMRWVLEDANRVQFIPIFKGLGLACDEADRLSYLRQLSLSSDLQFVEDQVIYEASFRCNEWDRRLDKAIQGLFQVRLVQEGEPRYVFQARDVKQMVPLAKRCSSLIELAGKIKAKLCMQERERLIGQCVPEQYRQKHLLQNSTWEDAVRRMNQHCLQILSVAATSDPAVQGEAKGPQIEEVKEEKAEPPFAKDLPPPGLPNLGNSCYLNTALQPLFSLRCVEERLSQISDENVENGALFAFKKVWEQFRHLAFVRARGGDVNKVNAVFKKRVNMLIRQLARSGDFGERELNGQQDSVTQGLLPLLRLLGFGLQIRSITTAAQKEEKGGYRVQEQFVQKEHVESSGPVFDVDLHPKYAVEEKKREQKTVKRNCLQKMFSCIVKILRAIFDFFCCRRTVSSSSHAKLHLDLQKQIDQYADGLFEDDGTLRFDLQGGEQAVPGAKRIQTRVQGTPPVIVLRLKRFTYSGKNASKNSTPVALSPKLSLNFKKLLGLEEEVDYQLVGVGEQSGGLGGGHYYGYVCRGEKWYKVNDSSVSEVARPETQNAYSLVFERAPLVVAAE